MAQVVETVDLEVPVSDAYRGWQQFESFGDFLSFVDSVTKIDATHHHWAITIAGATREFDTQIAEDIEDNRIAWTSVGGDVDHGGVVTFHRLSDDRSRVAVQIDWEPEGLLENLGAGLNVPNHAVSSALNDFKRHVESGTRLPDADIQI